MNMNKMALATMLMCGSISLANAATGGQVNFEGSITDTPCSIHPDSVKQTVKLGAVSKPGLASGINGPEQKVKIQLLNCSFAMSAPVPPSLVGSPVGNNVSVTFTGPQGGYPGTPGVTNTLLGITGSAKGASIQLIDYSSKPVILGQKTTLQELAQSSNTDLEFTAYLKPNPGVAASDIVEGNFTSTVNFIMNYE